MRLVAAVVTGVLIAAAAGLLPERVGRDGQPAWLLELCTEYEELDCGP